MKKAVVPMIPRRAEKRIVSLYLTDDAIAQVDAITQAEGVGSRNRLLVSLIDFASRLFTRLRARSSELDAYARRERVDHVEAMARLVERALDGEGKRTLKAAATHPESR